MPPRNNVELVARLITATITDTAFLTGLKALWEPSLVGSGWRWIAEESFQWLEEHGEAIGRNIELRWASRPMDEEAQQSLEGLLERLNAEYEASTEPLNTDELLHQAQQYLEREFLIRQALQIGEAAEAWRLDQARELAEGRPRQIIHISAINPAQHPDSIREAFAARSQPLVQLGGALQELLGERIVRDSLVVLLAEEKAGKSYLLQAIEFGAIKAGSNVIAFQCGDLSRWQKIGRMCKTLTLRSPMEKDCREVLMPVPDCLRSQHGKCDKHHQEPIVVEKKEDEPYPRLLPYADCCDWYTPCLDLECYRRKPTTWYRMEEACAELTENDALQAWARFNAVHPDRFMLETFPSETATVSQMDAVLTQLWERKRWKPRVVVVDYPDICGPEPGTASKDVRHQENAKWLALRRMSQKWECCVVAPTQAKENKNARDRRLLRPNMFSEDKRKKAHPTDALGLNIDKWDKRRKIWRLNYLFGREDAYDVEHDQVAVMHCLERGLPNLGSFWLKRRRT